MPAFPRSFQSCEEVTIHLALLLQTIFRQLDQARPWGAFHLAGTRCMVGGWVCSR